MSIRELAVRPERPPPQAKARAAAAALQAPSLQALATAQLRQLAKLPSLNTVVLADPSCPTLFLVALGTQLTRLHLDQSYRECEPDTEMPTPAWRSALQHVARCTQLQDLHIPCSTEADLSILAPALQQLRTLRLTGQAHTAGGDAMAEALLGLPHLTSLNWEDTMNLCLRRSHIQRPCRWEALRLGLASVQHLARLPLQALKQPVRWSGLSVPHGTPLHEVRAAVANVMRGCPAGFRWECDGEHLPTLGFPPNPVGAQADVLGVLRALRPLMAPLTSLHLGSVVWDVELAKVLGEALPRTCTRLVLSGPGLDRQTVEQVVRCMPWVERLEMNGADGSSSGVLGCLRRLCRLKQGGGGGVRLEEVVVRRPERPQGLGEEEHRQAWERAARAVREEGGGVVLRVVW